MYRKHTKMRYTLSGFPTAAQVVVYYNTCILTIALNIYCTFNKVDGKESSYTYYIITVHTHTKSESQVYKR